MTTTNEQLTLIDETGAINESALPTAVGVQAQDEQQRIDRFLANWQNDIRKIGEALNQLAVERDWCGEYERIIENLNDSLYFKLETRSSDRTVYVEGTGIAEITIDLSIEFPTHFSEAERTQMIRDRISRILAGYDEYNSVSVESTEIYSIDHSNYSD